MALNQTRTWLIAYDITSPKRLGRVHRYLKKVAIPVQHSVFVAEENDAGIQRIRNDLAKEIDPRSDYVRMYPLPKRLEIHHYGRRALPEGLLMLNDQGQRASGLLVNPDFQKEAT